MFVELLIAGAIAATSPEAASAAPFAGREALDEEVLAQATAREDVAQIANSDQAASVSDSSVSGEVQTGSATFSDNAFQNVSGLTVVNANTGNNVAINGAIVVNVAITPAQP